MSINVFQFSPTKKRNSYPQQKDVLMEEEQEALDNELQTQQLQQQPIDSFEQIPLLLFQLHDFEGFD